MILTTRSQPDIIQVASVGYHGPLKYMVDGKKRAVLQRTVWKNDQAMLMVSPAFLEGELKDPVVLLLDMATNLLHHFCVCVQQITVLVIAHLCGCIIRRTAQCPG